MATVYQTLVAKALSNSNQALAITAGRGGDASGGNADNNVYIDVLDYSSDLQYWELRPTRDDNAFAMVNKARGMCLARASDDNGASLILVGVDQIPINDLAVWRHDNVSGTYNAINSYKDWEQKINIPGSGPYRPGQQLITWEWSGASDNELWAQVADASKVTMKSIDFNLDAGNIQDQEPLVAGTQTLVNTSSQDQEQTVTFRFLQSHTYSFEYERGLDVSLSIEFKAGLPIVGESKIKTEIKGTWKWSTREEESDEQEFTLAVPVKVPARTSIRVSVVALRARLDCPYKAVIEYQYPDGTRQEKTSSGWFSGINGYNVTTKYEQLGTIPETLQVMRFDRLRGGVATPATPGRRPVGNGHGTAQPVLASKSK